MKSIIRPYWQSLYESFDSNRNPEKAKWGKAYMRNQYEMFGLASPLRTELLRLFIGKQGLPDSGMVDEIVINAWELPEREMQYVAMEVLFRMRKDADVQMIGLYEWMITHKSWWDTVDYISPNLVGNLFMKYPELKDSAINKWMNSGNFWLQRTCLLYQLKYKTQTDSALLFNLCARLSNEKEFFIRKAIGWALREYAKTNPLAVQEFVDKTPLSGLSRREALKHIK